MLRIDSCDGELSLDRGAPLSACLASVRGNIFFFSSRRRKERGNPKSETRNPKQIQKTKCSKPFRAPPLYKLYIPYMVKKSPPPLSASLRGNIFFFSLRKGKDFTTRFARGTEIRRNLEHGDRVNWSCRIPACQIHPTALIGAKDKRKTLISLSNSDFPPK